MHKKDLNSPYNIEYRKKILTSRINAQKTYQAYKSISVLIYSVVQIRFKSEINEDKKMKVNRFSPITGKNTMLNPIISLMDSDPQKSYRNFHEFSAPSRLWHAMF